ncbi:MAG: polyprenol monophosphomannose synthase [Pseudomonadota bacterium]
MSRPDRSLVIVPTYNERENVPAIARTVHQCAPDVDVLFVDDNSPDGTGQVAAALAAAEPWVKVLHRSSKQGLGTAYIAGFRQGLAEGYGYFVEMDADFSHDPAYLPEMLRLARTQADVVVGSRYAAGGGTGNWGFCRRLLSRMGSVYARSVLGVPISDLTAGFVCYRREVIERLDLEAILSEGYSFQIEMKFRAVKAGFRVLEMPITFVDRRVGQSKMSGRIVLEALGTVWMLRLRS